jgi:hypothetical protein
MCTVIDNRHQFNARKLRSDLLYKRERHLYNTQDQAETRGLSRERQLFEFT